MAARQPGRIGQGGLDPTIPELAEAVKSAREVLIRLRARAYLDQLEAATHREPVSPAPDRTRPRNTSSV